MFEENQHWPSKWFVFTLWAKSLSGLRIIFNSFLTLKHGIKPKPRLFEKSIQDQINNGTIVAKHQQKQSTVNLSDVPVPTVRPSVPWDIDHKVDGELNAKPITPGHIQSFLHASRVLIFPTKFQKSTLKHK